MILLLCPAAFGQVDFPAFWKKFKSAVVGGDKTAVTEIRQFPLSMYQRDIKNRAEFLRRYNEIVNGEGNAAQYFGSAGPQKESARHDEIYCPFKETPNDKANTPIRLIFELAKTG